MSKQLIFFISDRNNVDIIANRIIDMGFEVVKKESTDSDSKRLVPSPATLQDFSAPWFKVRLHKPAYGTVKTIFDPHIEWFQGAVLEGKKEIVSGRFFLDTTHFSEYEPQLQELLTSDYTELCKELRKIVPRLALEINGVEYKQRMDQRTVQLLHEGYKLVF